MFCQLFSFFYGTQCLTNGDIFFNSLHVFENRYIEICKKPLVPLFKSINELLRVNYVLGYCSAARVKMTKKQVLVYMVNKG